MRSTIRSNHALLPFCQCRGSIRSWSWTPFAPAPTAVMKLTVGAELSLLSPCSPSPTTDKAQGGGGGEDSLLSPAADEAHSSVSTGNGATTISLISCRNDSEKCTTVAGSFSVDGASSHRNTWPHIKLIA